MVKPRLRAGLDTLLRSMIQYNPIAGWTGVRNQQGLINPTTQVQILLPLRCCGKVVQQQRPRNESESELLILVFSA